MLLCSWAIVVLMIAKDTRELLVACRMTRQYQFGFIGEDRLFLERFNLMIDNLLCCLIMTSLHQWVDGVREANRLDCARIFERQ